MRILRPYLQVCEIDTGAEEYHGSGGGNEGQVGGGDGAPIAKRCLERERKHVNLLCGSVPDAADSDAFETALRPSDQAGERVGKEVRWMINGTDVEDECFQVRSDQVIENHRRDSLEAVVGGFHMPSEGSELG